MKTKKQHKIGLSPEQLGEIEEFAKKIGLSFSAFCRVAVLEKVHQMREESQQ